MLGDVYIWPWLTLLLIVLKLVQFITSRYYKLVSMVPASKAPRFIGHALDFVADPNELLDKVVNIFNAPTSNRKVLAIWSGPLVFVYLRDLQDIEKLLSNNVNIRKSINYSHLEAWLGQGLINSEGKTWQTHRKLITPSFHFKILEGFLDTMVVKSSSLIKVLDENIGKDYFNIEPYIARYALDIISETAMSSSYMNNQEKDSDFVNAIKSLTEIIIIRSVRAWFHFDLLFNLSSFASLQRRSTSCVNNAIVKIIEKKKEEMKTKLNCSNTQNEYGEKKKLALLDLLLEAQATNPEFSDKEILDEVNTFMFAGYDTTTSGMSFVLYLLSLHQEIQEKVYNEINENLSDRTPTYRELMSLKYLERVIKESLRLFPPVPFIGRELKQEMKISSGFILPKKCNTAIFIYNHHRNPEIWPEPEKFDPDRFLPENSVDRNPYAFIPFSAGSRNCIGQKYAMMEMMLTVTVLLRHYRIIADPSYKMQPVAHIVLRPDSNGIRLKLERR